MNNPTYPARKSDGRFPYEISGTIYLREDEQEAFEDALEKAICPCEDDENGEHDCRLGLWTLGKLEITCDACGAIPAPVKGYAYEDEHYCQKCYDEEGYGNPAVPNE